MSNLTTHATSREFANSCYRLAFILIALAAPCFSARAWKQVANLKPKEGGFVFTPNWFGCYAWDPVNNILYASAMGNPVYKLEL